MDDTFKIELNYKNNYSYGIFHSGYELFRSIYVENLTEHPFEKLNISVQTTPNILLKGDCVVDSLAPFGYRFLSCDFVRLDLSQLASISSVLNISVSIQISDADNTLLKRVDFPCRLLPYFYFTGFGDMPEMLSFFVTPDQEEIASIDVDGVSSDPFDYCHQLYDNIKEKKITFASEDYSGSFPLPIRLCERVLKERFANSLELSLLFASCCEKNGLSPLIAFSGKKAYVGFSLRSGRMNLMTAFDKNRKNFDDLYFLDGSYFAYGSELAFDAALYHSKNALMMSDEKIVVLDILTARQYKLLPLPNRFFDRGNLYLSERRDGENAGNFDDFFSLMNRFANDSRIVSILKGERISAGGHKASVPFQIDLDVNQNKILSKILSNDFTLIRSQTGSGVSKVFATAAAYALKNGKRVLYVTDPRYHSDSFVEHFSAFASKEFVFQTNESDIVFSKEAFTGLFSEHSSLFDDLDSMNTALKEMDAYYSSLEGEKRIVSSFLLAADRYHQLRDANDCIIFSPEQVGMLSDEMVQNWFSTVNELVKAISDMESIDENPLSIIRTSGFSYEYKSKLIRQLEDVLRCIEGICSLRDQIKGLFPSTDGLRSMNVFLAFLELVRLFGEFYSVPESFFEFPENIEENFRRVTALIQAKKENDSISETILISFQNEILELDAMELFERYRSLTVDKSFKAISQKHGILKSVKRFLKPNCDVENVEYILSRLYEYQKNRALILKERDSVFRLLSVPNRDLDEDWQALQFAADLCYQCYSVFLSAFSQDQLSAFVNDYRAVSDMPGVLEKLVQLRQFGEEYISLKEDLERLIGNQIDFSYPEASAKDQDYFQTIYNNLSSVLGSADHLKNWCNWLSIREKALRIGMKNIVSAVENGKIKADECKRSFLRAFFKAVCEYNFIAHPDLVPDRFSFEDAVDRFREAKGNIEQKRCSELNSILSVRRLEALNEILSEQINVRDLLRENFSLFSEIYPCVVSDVATAARLFDHQPELFDYVFIESCRDLRLLDLILLMGKGKKVAFAGAFSLSREWNEKGPDLEGAAFDYLWNVTDEKYSLSAVYSGNPMLTAAKRAYGQALRSDCNAYTVPAVSYSPCFEWHQVSGSFDTEYPGANLAEAEFCVDRLVRFAMEETSRTIVIIATTLQQKKLILRLLTQKLRHQEELAGFFGDYKRFSVVAIGEPLPISDTVVFSTVFAPDRSLHAGRLPFVALEFGGSDPYKVLLQVLSSATRRFSVVSSFSSEELKFSSSVLPAISALSLLLRVLHLPAVNNTFALTGGFENASVIRKIKSELEERGYAVSLGVQSGRYYVDLAVMNENGVFILGILSDQTVMNQQANISAIELSNSDFYKKHGWRLFRLRATECFDSFERVMEEILRILSPEKNFDLI